MMAARSPSARAIEKKGWWLAHKWLMLRRSSQILILLLFLLGPWAGIWIIKGNLASSKILDTVPLTEPLLYLQMLAAGFVAPVSAALVGALIVLTFYLLVGGRVYCSWVCPMNLVTDAAYWLRVKLNITTVERLPRNTRYWVLGMVLVVALATGSLAYELVNPVSLLHRGIIFGIGAGWVVVLGIFLFDVFVISRGWCGHLCPMGAFYGVVGKFSPLKVRADRRDVCDGCADCFAVCPEPQILPPVLKGEKTGELPVVVAGECTNCGRCIDICHLNVFRFGARFHSAWPTKRLLGSGEHA